MYEGTLCQAYHSYLSTYVSGKICGPFLGCTVSSCKAKGVSQHQRAAPRQAVCRGESGRPHRRPAPPPRRLGPAGRGRGAITNLTILCHCTRNSVYFIGFTAPRKDFQVFIFLHGSGAHAGLLLGLGAEIRLRNVLKSVYETSCLRNVRTPLHDPGHQSMCCHSVSPLNQGTG